MPCKGYNHFAKQCYKNKRKVYEVKNEGDSTDNDSEESNDLYIDTINTVNAINQ